MNTVTIGAVPALCENARFILSNGQKGESVVHFTVVSHRFSGLIMASKTLQVWGSDGVLVQRPHQVLTALQHR